MKIIIEGTQKEIAEFTLAVQNRRYSKTITPLTSIKKAVSSTIGGIVEAQQEPHS